MHKKATSGLKLGVIVVLLAGCGMPPNQRLFTRPPSYPQSIAWMQYGHPIDLEEVVAKFPALKGRVITAPEYIEEYERLVKERLAEGKPVYEYRIAPGSTIDVIVQGEEELTRRGMFVPPDGYDQFPYIGRIKLIGLTRDELKQVLESKYRSLLKKPEVLVHLRSGYQITPTGDRAASLGFPLPGQDRITILGGGSRELRGSSGRDVGLFGGETLFTVLDGPSPGEEWRAIRVIRRDDQDPLHKSRIIFCDAWEFIANGDVRQDIPLRPGDFVFVPPVYTLGEHFLNDLGLVQGLAGQAISIDALMKSLDTTFFD